MELEDYYFEENEKNIYILHYLIEGLLEYDFDFRLRKIKIIQIKMILNQNNKLRF